jgi:integrase
LLYGSGLHLRECLSLRIKDIDFERREIHVRGRKGRAVRPAPLSPEIIPDFRAHLHGVREQHDRDLLAGAGYVAVPELLRLSSPDAPREWAWQWCFPAAQTYVHQVSGHRCRHHVHESVVQHAIRHAAVAAHLPGDVSAHTLHLSFAANFLEDEACA